MATSYATESIENKALIDNWAANLRAELGEFHRVWNRLDVIRSQYNEEISVLLSAWDATETVPNNTGLAGSSPTETHEQMETWQSYLDTFDTNLGGVTFRAQYVSAAGPGNVLG